ncbi:penicillin-binding protein 2 [Yoonia litorea]|uniref:Penicillin-binding protein 2 n=1 Tax=Yoonia litorea TaxID=1123755 RepID=A0A1I6N3J5_9RHOB|nr:penicillin-binding protein 2 [Yoonia litorea]SFS22368.1 penicillin-binding protein 2 [Yoonia litorea]
MVRRAKDQALQFRQVSRRALIVGIGQVGILGIIGWRMRSLQIEDADQYRLLAEENRINMQLIPPSRGMIFDRNGALLADNEQNYRLVITREEAGDPVEAIARLANEIELDPDDIGRALSEMEQKAPFIPVTLKEHMSWEEVAFININAPALPGIRSEVGLSRHYPFGADLAHVVGYVGPVSDYDLSRTNDPDPLLRIPRFQIGKTGVENKLEQSLRGKAGSRQVEVNASGRVIRSLGQIDSAAGEDVQLTIDTSLQSYAQDRLAGESASAIVMDIETGELRCVASAPTFDPNQFVRGISVENWSALNEDPYRPLAAKAFQGAYPPGSTYKMIVALAALEAGVIGPEETVYCPGFVDVGETRFHCWKRGGHGNVNLHESLKQSCDSYYYEVSQRVGIDAISRMAHRFGIGVRHELPLSAVAQGLNPTREWKRDVRDEAWRVGDTVNASIGQGYVLASPLQLATMTARLASGRNVTPQLVKSGVGPDPWPVSTALPINENALRRCRAAMEDVVNHNRGTAYRSRILTPEHRLAGKTGTSQVRRITPEERALGIIDNKDLPWARRDHALFVGYAPFDSPKYSIAVVVEHGGGGSSAAAPIARDIMLQALFEGQPPLEAYPEGQRSQISEQQRRLRLRAMSPNQARDRT